MTDNLLEETDDLPELDPNKNYLEELVGEGRKFKTPEELAKGKYMSDLYIKDLERGRDMLKQDYLKLREESDLGAKLDQLRDQLMKQQQLASSDNHLNANEDNKPTFDPEQLDSLVSNKILQYENTKKQTENFNTVRDKLKQRFGNNYQVIVKQQIDELGISEADLNQMARTQPKVAMRTLGLDQEPVKEGFQAPPLSRVRSDSFAPSAGTKRTWTYYEKLRKDNPNLYWSNKVQTQMHQDHAAYGKDFEDGDWSAV